MEDNLIEVRTFPVKNLSHPVCDNSKKNVIRNVRQSSWKWYKKITTEIRLALAQHRRHRLTKNFHKRQVLVNAQYQLVGVSLTLLDVVADNRPNYKKKTMKSTLKHNKSISSHTSGER